MQCDRFREAISARIDGEDPGLPDGALDAHLEACADCRAWQQRAHAVTRRARLGGSSLIMTSPPRCSRPSRPRPPGGGGGSPSGPGWPLVAAAQLAITVPLLLLGHDHDAGASRGA